MDVAPHRRQPALKAAGIEGSRALKVASKLPRPGWRVLEGSGHNLDWNARTMQHIVQETLRAVI
jgi:hypothetical protein